MTKRIVNSDNQVNEHLFSDFPKPSIEQWREVTQKSLKGGTIEEKLVTNTYEGIPLQPMYSKEDVVNFPHLFSNPGSFPYVRGTSEKGYLEKPWEVSQEINYSTPEEFNQAARHDLEKGLTTLHLILDDSPFSNINEKLLGRKGITLSSIKDFEKAFVDINLDEIPIYFETGIVGYPFYSTFMSYLKQQSIDIKKLSGCISFDPLGQLVQNGALPYSITEAYKMLSEVTKASKEHTPDLKTIDVQVNPYHESGGNAVHELAFAISTGLEYLRELANDEISIDDVAKSMQFSFSIGANFFMEIAKLRAARMLWSQIVKELGGSEDAQKMYIHARTSTWTKTIYDPYVNILRSTVEAFGAVIGGVNSLHVSPFDEAIGPADEFSRRIARNTHMILEKEANLSKVADPAGGSWYIESLTYSLAEKAWELFQKIEEKGGMYKAILEGFPQEIVLKTAEERAKNIKKRKDKFIGTNIYPNLNENKRVVENQDAVDLQKNNIHISKEENVLLNETLQQFAANRSIENAIKAVDLGASIDDLFKLISLHQKELPSVRTVEIHRGAQIYETLRQNAENYKSSSGQYPTIFVANLGPVAAFKPRVDFVTNFFEVGGFEVLNKESYTSINDAVEAFHQSNSSIVVICSKDENYPEMVPVLVKKLKDLNSNTTILLAGNPSEEELAIYKHAGLTELINLKVNNYEMLDKLQLKGGIK